MSDTKPAKKPVEHFEPFEQALADDYPARVSAIRDRCPVSWSESNWSATDAGFWLLTTFDDVSAAAQNWEHFSSAEGAAPVQFDLEVFRMIPLETDPPLHRSIRKVLSPFFAPEASKAAEPQIRSLVQELLGRCTEKRPSDFVVEVATPMPSRVFFEIFLGEDPAAIADIIDIIDTLFADPAAAAERAPDLLGWCATVLETRKAEGRRDDVLGAVAHIGENEGDPELDDFQKMQTVMLLMLAGMETTATALSNVAFRLASDEALRRHLRDADERALNRAVDEFLRFDSPVPASGRTLTSDTEVSGCPMAAGERVTLNWTAANRDPAAFVDPDELDVARPDATKHLGFGAGPHRCLGSHLAKRELRIAIEEICKLSTFSLAEDVRSYRAGPARGPVSVFVNAER